MARAHPGMSRQGCVERSQKRRERGVAASEVVLAPNKDLLAVVWELRPWIDLNMPSYPGNGVLVGLSIYAAVSGQQVHSMLLKTIQYGFPFDASQLVWLPCSSNLVFVNSCGLLHLMSTQGDTLWSLSAIARSPRSMEGFPQGRDSTEVKASPCGRWILVTDAQMPSDHACTVQISIVEAATGNIVCTSLVDARCDTPSGTWSESGNVCFFHEPPVVLVYSPSADMPQAFVQAAIASDGPGFLNPGLSGSMLSLSPCGRTVVGLEPEHVHPDVLHSILHLQLPFPAPSRHAQAAELRTDTCAMLHSNSMHFRRMAWHPRRSACIYAIADSLGSVHCFDARADRCIASWSEAELYDSIRIKEPGEDSDSSSDDDADNRPYRPCILSILQWSADGSKLAVAYGSRCSVLHF